MGAGVVVAAGTVDGVAADGVLAGGLAGDRDGGGVAVGDGADHDSSWRRDFTAADVGYDVLPLVRGDLVGFSSTGAGDWVSGAHY